MYLDSYGLPVDSDGDTGDTAHRVGWISYGLNLLKKLKCPVPQFPGLLSLSDSLPLLEPRQDGWLVRHPDRMDFSDFSRDQQISIVVSLGRAKLREPLKRIFLAHLKRGFRYQNGDIGFLEIGCLYIRAFRAWYLWPLLVFFDLWLLGNSIIKMGFIPLWREDQKKWSLPTPNDVDDLNHILMLVEGLGTFPTPIGLLAGMLYRLFRPKNNGNLILGEKSPIMGAVAWYFRPEARGNPEWGELYRPIIGKILDSRALK